MRVPLTKAIDKKLLVIVRRNVHGMEEIEGFILGASKDWLLVREVSGCAPDGFYLVRRNTVSSLISTVYCDFRRHILEKERLLEKALRHPGVDFGDVSRIFSSLHRLGLFITVGMENRTGWRTLHSVVDEVLPDMVSLRGFDGAGRWERRRYGCLLAKVTAVKFGSRYLKMYQKYASKDFQRS